MHFPPLISDRGRARRHIAIVSVVETVDIFARTFSQLSKGISGRSNHGPRDDDRPSIAPALSRNRLAAVKNRREEGDAKERGSEGTPCNQG